MAELEIKPTTKMRLRVFALISIAAALAAIQAYLLAGGFSYVFARRVTLTTYLPDGTGVTTDSEVRLSGITIGKVEEVELTASLNPRRVVRVQMRVLAQYLRNIPADSQTDVNADTMVSDKFIEIVEGMSPLPIAEDSVLQTKAVIAATDRADLIANLQQDLAQVDQILAQMSSPQTQIGRFVTGEAEYDRLLSTITGFENALHNFLTPRNKLGKAIYSPEMYNQIVSSISGVDKMLMAIQNGEGTAGHLFASDEQYNAFIRRLTDLRSSLADANAGKGKLGSLLQDDAAYLRITRLLASTDAMISSLNAGEGRAGRLLTNQQLYESLNGSLRSMDALLRDFQENPQKYLHYKLF